MEVKAGLGMVVAPTKARAGWAAAAEEAAGWAAAEEEAAGSSEEAMARMAVGGQRAGD